jgi:hypothetical protein
MSVSLLPNIFQGTPLDGLAFSVEIAPGADVTAASSTWTFTDVTEDVMFSQNVQIDEGRGDEQSEAQTATLKVSLLNDDGDYTPRRRSGAYWPDMRVGFPIRVSLTYLSTTVDIFTGYVDELAPSWDESTKIAIVNVTAHGTIQRLNQGDQKIKSNMAGATTDDTFADTLVGYWPMTDLEKSVGGASGLANGSPMTVQGTMNWAAYSDFDCTEPIATFTAGSNISAPVSTTSTSDMAFRSLLFPAAAIADNQAMFQFVMQGGTLGFWHIRYTTSGGMRLTASNASGTQVYDGGAGPFGIDSRPLQIGLDLSQNGADVDWDLWIIYRGDDGQIHILLTNGTAASFTMGKCVGFSAGGNGTMTDWAIGQIGINNDLSWLYGPTQTLLIFTGFEQEYAHERIQRICDEAGVPLTINAAGGSLVSMGPQPNGATLLDAIAECEAVDHGLIYDGEAFGLVYNTRDWLENASVGMALDIRDGHVMPPFEPLENTRLVRNDITVTRKQGSSARLTQPAGQPYAVADVGKFAETVTLNLESDGSVLNHAGWLLHVGTVDSDRYTSLNLDLSASPSLAATWLTKSFIGARITVTGLPDTGGEDADLLVEGISTVIGPQDWAVSLNCSPAIVYDVGVLNDVADNYSTHEAVLDTGTSTVGTNAVLGATSLSVSTTALWTTTAGDLPLYLWVDGRKIRVTAISGSSSPQTFTVDALPANVSAGAQVRLWTQSYLAL